MRDRGGGEEEWERVTEVWVESKLFALEKLNNGSGVLREIKGRRDFWVKLPWEKIRKVGEWLEVAASGKFTDFKEVEMNGFMDCKILQNSKGDFGRVAVGNDNNIGFLCLPRGRGGSGWKKLSSMLMGSLDDCPHITGSKNQSESAIQLPFQSSRSYASVLRSEGDTANGELTLISLQNRVKSLEAEVAELKSRLEGNSREDAIWISSETGMAAVENRSGKRKVREPPSDLGFDLTVQIGELTNSGLTLDSDMELEDPIGVELQQKQGSEINSEPFDPVWIVNQCYEEGESEVTQEAVQAIGMVYEKDDSSHGENFSLMESTNSIVDSDSATLEDNLPHRQDCGNAVASLSDIIPATAECWDLEESSDEMAASSSYTPCFTLQEKKENENARERKRWERSASKLKENLRKKEETLWEEDIPEGFSMGEHILIDGEIFDGLAIVKMLIPPSRAKRSRLAFHYWSSLVGRPLLRKLREAGIDIDLDLFGKDQLVSVVKP